MADRVEFKQPIERGCGIIEPTIRVLHTGDTNWQLTRTEIINWLDLHHYLTTT